MRFPNGRRFAFSIFDDTDVATLVYIRPIYAYLEKLGMRTTKTVWTQDYSGKSNYQGSDTLENPDYANFVRTLSERGFEIAFHGTTMESATREQTLEGLERYRGTLGGYPRNYAAHSFNRDNLYWGEHRFAFGPTRRLYRLISGDDPEYFRGDVEDDPFFWGDLARKYLQYARSFTFASSELLSLGLPLVYTNPRTRWIKRWYLTADADNVEEFNRLISPDRQQKLQDAGGICIISTHLGKGFTVSGELHPDTQRLLKMLSDRDGWFVPVSDILDHYVAEAGCGSIENSTLLRMELRWFMDSLRRRFSKRDYNKTEIAYLAENQDVREP